MSNTPVPSDKISDLKLNVLFEDIFATSRVDEFTPDRTGVPRITMFGMERRMERLHAAQNQFFDGFMVSSKAIFDLFIASSGYANLGEYGPGITINTHNQGFMKCDPGGTGCLFYTPKSSTSLPYTTTGDWDSEGGLFVVRGDDSLRQELSDPSKGLKMIGYGNATAFDQVSNVVWGHLDPELNIRPNIPEDQTDAINALFDKYRGDPSTVINLLPGNYVITAKNQKTIQGQVVNYALDISGIRFNGVAAGYRNANGTMFTMEGVPGVALYQAQVNSALIKCFLRDITVRGSVESVLWLTYSVGSQINNLSWAGDSIWNAIRIGDRRYDAGAMSNILVQCSGAATQGPALILEGKDWNNANFFLKCFFTGLQPSIIDCDGGFGAVANMYFGTEFASPVGGGAGLIIGRSFATTFVNGYFESRGPSIWLRPRAHSVKADNCTFAVSDNNNASGKACFIYHDGQGSTLSASIIICGGWISTNSGTAFEDMTFIDGDGTAPLDVTIEVMPILQTLAPRFSVMKEDFVRTLRALRGSFSASVTPRWSSLSPDINIGSGRISGRYSVSGRRVNYSVMLVKGADTTFSNNNQLILIAPTPMRFAASQPDYIGRLRISWSEGGDTIVIDGDATTVAAGSPASIFLRRQAPGGDYGYRYILLRGDWLNSLPANAKITMSFDYEN